MADLGVTYTLTTPGGTIIFNESQLDQPNDYSLIDDYYLMRIQGLDGPSLRTPIDPQPQADGGILHNFWKSERHVVFEGVMLIRSTRIGNAIVAARNQMEADLRTALESILQADGTLAWTPLGQSAKALTVRHDVPFETDGIEAKNFVFGLVAADPDY